MKSVLKFVKPYLWLVVICLFFKTSAAFAELAIPALLARIIDEAVPADDMKMVMVWGGLMILLAVAMFLLNILGNRYAAIASGKASRDLRHALFVKISYLDAEATDALTLSSLTSRMTSDTYVLTSFFARLQRMGVKAPLILIGGIIITLFIDWRLALVLISVMPFVCLTVYLVSAKSVPIYAEEQTILDDIVKQIDETSSGIRVIKALSKTEHEKKKFKTVSERLMGREMSAGKIMSLTKPITDLLLNIGLVCVILLGALLARYYGFSATGKLLAFMTYFTIILNNMIAMTRIFIQMSRSVASAERIEEVLLCESHLGVGPGEKDEALPYITFENVSFSYLKRHNNLENISFSLEKGQTLGIIGATGSGKSTLVALLLRLYDVDSGRVTIGGRDIKSIPPEELHSMFGVAFQNDFVPAGTIDENVKFFRHLSDQTVDDALTAAQASFVFEEGKDRQITTRGTNLSGGQKQRMIVARALAGDPEIVILDDASSALDYRTDANLRHALHERRGKTTVIVSQRIASVRNSDVILVLDKGQLIGKGTHDQLMQNCPVYGKIAEVQFGGKGEKR
ncbi:MAG: ABC transporter ATP-binding protein/permease [Clostridia bacterium]|nr:ABC transporter ATP-binding protein/permease [Clostridia bacterium]